MKIILVRHGESVGNTKKGFISGRTDPEGLTDRGKVQIIRTAYELRKETVDHLLVSPVVRAQETAEILNVYVKKPVETKKWLTELHHGILEGSYWWEVLDQIPRSWRSKREDYMTPYPGGGESMHLLLKRAWEGIQEIFSSYDEKSTILIVSHQAVITALRYVLIFGDPAFATEKKQIDELLQFVHNTKLPNGGFVTAMVDHGVLKDLSETVEFSPIKERKDNAEFYIKGIFRISHAIRMQTLVTASSNIVYRAALNGTYIIKILNNKTESAATRQAALYTYLHEKNIPAPQVNVFDKSGVFYKDPVFVQDFVKGVSQKSCLSHQHKGMHTLLAGIYKMVEQIHALPVDDVKGFWFPQVDKQFQSWRTFMLFNINMTADYMRGSQVQKEKKEYILKRLQSLKHYIQENKYPRMPLHGDLAPENIITCHTDHRCNLTRIIDFEWARVGDPLWDYAYYWGWLEREDEFTGGLWYEFLSAKLGKKHQQALELYRVLFHAWTMRDTQDYKGSRIRERRGKRSREILEKLSLATD
jgi:probable phosphoglycerate mutase